jgi:hypothetical protein
MSLSRVYKVVRRRSDETYGPIGPSWDARSRIIYALKQRTRAPETWGPLSAFSDLEYAIAMALNMDADAMGPLQSIANGDLAIFECWFDPWEGGVRYDRRSTIVLWRKNEHFEGRAIHEVPAGTVLCKEISPDRLVTVEEIAGYLVPGAMMEEFESVEIVIVRPVIHIPRAGQSKALVRHLQRSSIQIDVCNFLKSLRKHAPPLAKIARRAFKLADQLARANRVKQFKLLRK